MNIRLIYRDGHRIELIDCFDLLSYPTPPILVHDGIAFTFDDSDGDTYIEYLETPMISICIDEGCPMYGTPHGHVTSHVTKKG